MTWHLDTSALLDPAGIPNEAGAEWTIAQPVIAEIGTHARAGSRIALGSNRRNAARNAQRAEELLGALTGSRLRWSDDCEAASVATPPPEANWLLINQSASSDYLFGEDGRGDYPGIADLLIIATAAHAAAAHTGPELPESDDSSLLVAADRGMRSVAGRAGLTTRWQQRVHRGDATTLASSARSNLVAAPIDRESLTDQSSGPFIVISSSIVRRYLRGQPITLGPWEGGRPTSGAHADPHETFNQLSYESGRIVMSSVTFAEAISWSHRRRWERVAARRFGADWSHRPPANQLIQAGVRNAAGFVQRLINGELPIRCRFPDGEIPRLGRNRDRLRVVSLAEVDWETLRERRRLGGDECDLQVVEERRRRGNPSVYLEPDFAAHVDLVLAESLGDTSYLLTGDSRVRDLALKRGRTHVMFVGDDRHRRVLD